MTTTKKPSISRTRAEGQKRKHSKRTLAVKLATKKVGNAALARKAFRKSLGRKQGTEITIDFKDIDREKQSGRNIKFGVVTVYHSVIDAETLAFNIASGREALGRAKDAFTKPGIALKHLTTVPKFRVDARDPKVIIRELDGHVDRGRIVNGAFVPAT